MYVNIYPVYHRVVKHAGEYFSRQIPDQPRRALRVFRGSRAQMTFKSKERRPSANRGWVGPCAPFILSRPSTACHGEPRGAGFLRAFRRVDRSLVCTTFTVELKMKSLSTTNLSAPKLVIGPYPASVPQSESFRSSMPGESRYCFRLSLERCIGESQTQGTMARTHWHSGLGVRVPSWVNPWPGIQGASRC